MRQRSREKVIGAALAILVTTIIVIEFLVDSKINTAPPPQVVYADSWYAEPHATPRSSPSRRSTRRKRDAAAKEKQRQFQKLEKQLGM